MPPTSLPATRKTAGWEEAKCQEMKEEEMVREVREADCSDEGGGLQALWQPFPQIARLREQMGEEGEICDIGADKDPDEAEAIR